MTRTATARSSKPRQAHLAGLFTPNHPLTGNDANPLTSNVGQQTFVAERIRTMLTAVRLPAVRPTDANQAGAGQRLINASEGVAVERGRDDLVTLSAEEANAYGLLDTVIGS